MAKTSCWPALLLSLLCISLLTASGQNTSNTPTPETWKESAVDISQTDLAGQKDVVRQQRSALFNDKRPNAPKLDSAETRKTVEGGFPPYFVRIPAIPVQESDAVIVGTVKAAQPYLSNDHAHLYTEFSIRVDEQMKDSSGCAAVGSTIPVVIGGGKMRLEDGRVIEEKSFANFTIAVGARYVFFLRYNKVGQHFAVAKSWELKNGAVVPTAHEDRMDARQGKGQFATMAEPKFIQAVHAAADRDQDRQ
ncbi:MAG TPA: hypothetical protein VIB39_03645 [Candidatus Angelobacter sp.]|jgi:hypothetical protein